MDQIERYRCYSKCLIPASRLINLRPDRDGRGYVASGPCPRCGASFHATYGEYGPADLSNVYEKVGVKVVRVPKVRCSARCMDATSLECKCSCGGEHHGLAA